jgi:hypothetical protein
MASDVHSSDEVGFREEEAQGHDICNDEALSRLQTTTNQKGTNRDCAMRMREAYLAGIVAQDVQPLLRWMFSLTRTCGPSLMDAVKHAFPS